MLFFIYLQALKSAVVLIHIYICNFFSLFQIDIHMIHPKPGWAEIDPELLWKQFIDVINEALTGKRIMSEALQY